MNVLVYAISQGLRVNIMSLTAERSRLIGGSHFHQMFGIPVHRKSVIKSTAEIKNEALLNLYRSIDRFCQLKRLNVLFIDEIGMLSRTSLAIMDSILREVRCSDKPFGGLLLIASGDHRQLDPIEGGQIWMSNLLMTSFELFNLKYLVRSMGDEDLGKLIDILRKPKANRVDHIELRGILRARCRENAKDNWSQVSVECFKIVMVA